MASKGRIMVRATTQYAMLEDSIMRLFDRLARPSRKSVLATFSSVVPLLACACQEQAEDGQQPNSHQQEVVEQVHFLEDPYLEGICEQDILPVQFQTFSSEDFIYDSPIPVRVSGEYYEFIDTSYSSPSTVYEEISATIFRNLKIEVLEEEYSPQFSTNLWMAKYSISDFPFLEHRQLRYRRAMGASFPFDVLSVERRGAERDGFFSENFISIVNIVDRHFLERTRELGGTSDQGAVRSYFFEATGMSYVRDQQNIREIEEKLQLVQLSSRDIIFSARGEFLIMKLSSEPLAIIVVSSVEDVAELVICGEAQGGA